MKSSSGNYYIGLDHIRALAAFLVFNWHFIHGSIDYPVSMAFLPTFFPFSILDEGHTGVALFMTLSGYLFVKLLSGKSIHYAAFLWNRSLRLLPLLALVLAIYGFNFVHNGPDLVNYLKFVAKGFIYPNYPSGGWSVAVEFHFYLLLPIFLWMIKKSEYSLLATVLAAIMLRSILFLTNGEVQSLAYFTLIGRIDQFALGMFIALSGRWFAGRHWLALGTFLVFTLIFWWFDGQGGFYKYPSYPSPSPFWIILPTLEAATYAILIAWYDHSFTHGSTGLSKQIARIGEASYSLYLLHFFFVHKIAEIIDHHIMDISNFHVACGWSLLCFILMAFPAYLSYRWFESPFLKLRVPYIKTR